VEIHVIPAQWPLAEQLRSVAFTTASRLGLDRDLREVVLVADDLGVDDHAWWRLDTAGGHRRLRLWLHPDQVLQDRPGRGAARRPDQDWRLGPVPGEDAAAEPDEFSARNAQRFLYQQLLLIQDVLAGRLDLAAVPAGLAEAFQEAWLVTVDGRLKREGLPHLSEAERRLRFLRRFGPAGVVTPGHWRIFRDLWGGEVATQAAVLGQVGRLPILERHRHG
jgi:hypothetical protein